MKARRGTTLLSYFLTPTLFQAYDSKQLYGLKLDYNQKKL